MIRVKVKEDNNVREICNYSYQQQMIIAEYGKENIIKAEKQVKDLTNNEMNQLDATPLLQYGKIIGIVCHAINGKKYCEYLLNDYIDITEIVKGEK